MLICLPLQSVFFPIPSLEIFLFYHFGVNSAVRTFRLENIKNHCIFQIEKLMKYLKAEKECRTDLEMYVAVISAQKNTLENDTDKIRNEMKEG